MMGGGNLKCLYVKGLATGFMEGNGDGITTKHKTEETREKISKLKMLVTYS